LLVAVPYAIPEGKSLYQALIDGGLDGGYIYPEGQDTNVDLRRFMPVSAADHISVTFEQNAIYVRSPCFWRAEYDDPKFFLMAGCVLVL
jgi:hypothetical protein